GGNLGNVVTLHPMRRDFALALSLVVSSLVALTSPTRSQAVKSPAARATKLDDPRVQDGAVFVKDAVGDGEGAPPQKNLGKVVVLTDLAKSDPWYALVTRVAQVKKAAVVIAFPQGQPERTKAELARELPEFALVVTKPDHLDVNVHFALLETLAALDA